MVRLSEVFIKGILSYSGVVIYFEPRPQPSSDLVQFSGWGMISPCPAPFLEDVQDVVFLNAWGSSGFC